MRRTFEISSASARKAGESARGFTLIELLVVVSIIAILMAILMPALNRARASAQAVYCLSNLKQWGITTRMYIADSNGYFWPHQNISPIAPTDTIPWNHYDNYARSMYLSELGRSKWFLGQAINGCPSKVQEIEHSSYTYRHWSYGLNYNLSNPSMNTTVCIPAKELDIRLRPSDVPWMSDVVAIPSAKIYYIGYYDSQAAARVGYVHSGGTANVLYADGHGDAVRYLDPAKMRATQEP